MRTNEADDDLRKEYDFRGGERGRYARRLGDRYVITIHRKKSAEERPPAKPEEKSEDS